MDNEYIGRERHLIVRALALAITAIDGAPPRQRPVSDRDEMAKMLEGLVPSDVELETVMQSARRIVQA